MFAAERKYVNNTHIQTNVCWWKCRNYRDLLYVGRGKHLEAMHTRSVPLDTHLMLPLAASTPALRLAGETRSGISEGAAFAQKGEVGACPPLQHHPVHFSFCSGFWAQKLHGEEPDHPRLVSCLCQAAVSKKKKKKKIKISWSIWRKKSQQIWTSSIYLFLFFFPPLSAVCA